MGFTTTLTAIGRSMAYTTPKYAKIIDYRLALTNLALQVLITFYVLYALIRGKTYLQTEVPIGRVTNWGSGTANFAAVQTAARTATTLTTQTFDGEEFTILPCSSSAAATALDDYNFVFDDTWVYANAACAYLTADELITKETRGGMFISTHATQTITYREPAPSSGTCAASVKFANEAGSATAVTAEAVALDSTVNNVCYYKKSTDWLFIGAEHTSIGIAHEFETASDIFAAQNPKTYVRRPGSNENLITFESGSSISLTLKQILDVAQVDLDKRYEDQPGDFAVSANGYTGSVDANRGPMMRLAGLRLNAKLMYYNYNLDGASQSTGDSDPYCILEIEPSITWTSLGQSITYRSEQDNIDDPLRTADGQPEGYVMNMYRYGVHIDISTSGIVGSFNYVYFINVVISGLVLLRVAGTICDLIAKYGLGTRSSIYSRHMVEETNFEREAARYAVQGMMAIDSYHQADSSGHGGLDIDELKELIMKAFNRSNDVGLTNVEKGSIRKDLNRLSESECKWLASAVMSSGDSEAMKRYSQGLPKMTYAELSKQNIGLDEWIELITESSMTVPLLKKIIEMDEEETKSREKLAEYLG